MCTSPSAPRTASRNVGTGIAVLHGFQDFLVVILPALRPAFHLENSNSLLAQQSNNRINQRKYDRIARRLRQRKMEIQVRLDECIGIRL